MSRTRFLLGSALFLSLVAFGSALLTPRPTLRPPGQALQGAPGPLQLQLRTSHCAVHASGSELFAEVSVTLAAEDAPPTVPVALALVLDTSGSMSGQKLSDARRAAHRLVDGLGEEDELALIAFGTEVRTEPLARLTSARRAAFHAAIDALEASGSTHLSGGLEAGWQALRRAEGGRRLVLVSDGQPTVGLTTSGQLVDLVARVHAEAITVTALGVGADIDGALLQHLSEQGGGMYGWLKDAATLDELLALEVTAARTARGRNVVLDLELDGLRLLEAPGRHLAEQPRGARLQLADLRPGIPTRVLLRLRSEREAGAAVRLGARVEARLPERGLVHTALRFTAPVLEDEAVVQASRDEAVYARGIGAVGSQRMVAAAAAYERGDLAGAGALLDNARALFGMSADALAGQAEVDDARRRFTTASPQARRELARGLERKKLSNFGRENEGY